jgi:hypothetical protein
MGWKCGRQEMNAEFWCGKLWESHHLDAKEGDGEIIVCIYLKEIDYEDVMDQYWVRIVSSSRCICGVEPLDSLCREVDSLLKIVTTNEG